MASRPAPPAGAIRYNNNTGEFEMSIGAGILGNAGGGAGGGGPISSQWQSVTGTNYPYPQTMPMFEENNHQFNCTKVENGWTVYYRGKTFIATTLEEMMDQMKAAMVTARIEK